MARTDHLFLLLGLSQSLFENRAARLGACRFGRNAFLARVQRVFSAPEKKFQREFRRSRRAALQLSRVQTSASEFFISREHTSGGLLARFAH